MVQHKSTPGRYATALNIGALQRVAIRVGPVAAAVGDTRYCFDAKVSVVYSDVATHRCGLALYVDSVVSGTNNHVVLNDCACHPAGTVGGDSDPVDARRPDNVAAD